MFCVASFASGDMLVASRFCLAIDGHVVNASIPTFIAGLRMLFASHYCFGIAYNPEVCATLDFMQR